MNPDEVPEGLARLLDDAAGPARPRELAGEVAAVAMFRREYRPVHRRRRRLIAIAMAAVTATAVGGTAFAASSGRLPAPVQSWFDGVGTAPTTTAAPRPTTGAPRATTSAPAAAPGSSATGTVSALEACRAWVAFRADPHNRPVTGEERKELARLAGGEKAIEEYCAKLLGTEVAPTAEPNAEPTAGPTSKKPKPSRPARP
jgi:hypothetical protein